MPPRPVDDFHTLLLEPVVRLHNIINVFNLMIDVLDSGARGRHKNHRMMHGANAQERRVTKPVRHPRIDQPGPEFGVSLGEQGHVAEIRDPTLRVGKNRVPLLKGRATISSLLPLGSDDAIKTRVRRLSHSSRVPKCTARPACSRASPPASRSSGSVSSSRSFGAKDRPRNIPGCNRAYRHEPLSCRFGSRPCSPSRATSCRPTMLVANLIAPPDPLCPVAHT
jgi:hypothetical protein